MGALKVPLTPNFLFLFSKRAHNLVKIKVPLTPKFSFLFSKRIHNLGKILKKIEYIHKITAKLKPGPNGPASSCKWTQVELA